MTAYPSSRQEAGDSDIIASSRQPAAAKTWTVPRETNVGPLNRGLPGNVPLHSHDESTVSNPGSDRLSVSGISSVSSSTLASEVLERARKRRDEFWGTP